MLRYKDFELEVAKLYKKAEDGSIAMGDLVKGIELLGKFLRDVRSNQIRMMEKLGVEKRDGRPSKDSNSTEKTPETKDKTE